HIFHELRTAFRRTAVSVSPPVPMRRDERIDEIGVPGMKLYRIIARLDRARGGISEFFNDPGNILLVGFLENRWPLQLGLGGRASDLFRQHYILVARTASAHARKRRHENRLS